MIDLVVAADDLRAIQSALNNGHTEECAVLFARQTQRADGRSRLLVREIQFPLPEDYVRKSPIEAELRPEFVARVTKMARQNEYSLVFVHSHVDSRAPVFSSVDDYGEKHLANFLSRRHPTQMHVAMVISSGGMRARRLGLAQEIRIVATGVTREILFDPDVTSSSISHVFDRQVRAFGADGQQALNSVRIAIVGLGGTGSIIAQQLAHLGVRDFILVDPDVIEATNLNRVAHATVEDLGLPKVRVAGRYIRSVAPDANIVQIDGDIIRAQVARELTNADIIFGCTDSHGSRAVLQQISYQYLIPCIDMGSTITVVDGRIEHIFGRVQLLTPGVACFTCSGLLNPAEVRRDMMSAFERQADPYIQGAREPAPAVMSLNSTVSSLAVTMLLSLVAGVPSRGRHILYNAIHSTMRAVSATADPNCYICSRLGSFAQGDSWPLLARQD